MDEEVVRDRELHGKKPLKDDDRPPETRTVFQSTTDPECGLFHKGEYEKQFAYVANTACDNHNFILDFALGAGNFHDSVMFKGLYEKVLKKFP